MGSVAVVLILLGAGVLIGRIAGPSLAARYLLSAVATLVVSAFFLAWVMVAR